MALGDGIRRNIASVDPEERALLRDALIKLNRQFFPGSRDDFPIPGGVSWWFKQDEIHAATHVHGGPQFLPWHRELVNRFEELLRQIDARLSMHYWDWTQDPRAIPNANLGGGQRGTLNLFTEDFMGYGGPTFASIGEPWLRAGCYDPRATIHRDSIEGNQADPPSDVIRSIGGSPISPLQDIELIKAVDFSEFDKLMEPLHRQGHTFVNMGGPHVSFRDPFVFLLHSNVDRLFARWQNDPAHPERLDPTTVYGSQSDLDVVVRGQIQNLNHHIEPWAGVSPDAKRVRPWAPPENQQVVKTYKDPSVVNPPPFHRNYYFHLDRSGSVRGAPDAAGSPASVVVASTGGSNIVYLESDGEGGTNGNLQELWMLGLAQGRGNLTTAPDPDATKSSADPSIYLNTLTQLPIALYRGTDNHVHGLYWTEGGIGHDRLSQNAAGAPAAKVGAIPAGYYSPAMDIHHVIYWSEGDHIEGLFWIGVRPVHYEGQPLDVLGSGPKAKGNPSAYIVTVGKGVNIVVYRGEDDHIHSLYWEETGEVGHDDLSAWGVAPAPNTVGDPFAYYIPHLDMHQVTYRAERGQIYELSWKGHDRVVPRNLTLEAEPSAPPADSDPVAYYSAATNSKHVFYRDAEGRLHELMWWLNIPGDNPFHTDLTAEAHAPNAVGKPSAFTIEPNSHHVVYRGADDNNIHEIRWEILEVPFLDGPSHKYTTNKIGAANLAQNELPTAERTT